jgi:tripartite-type tricarboxylate transporter receptor subunit TctC
MTIVRALAAATLLAASPAWAQPAYPAKTVRLVVPFTPGGSTDILGRVVAQKLTEAWGQQVVVDNRPGAGGTIGVELVAKAPPDGYTLVMGHIGTFGVNPSLYPKLAYDAVKDFAPVSLVALVPNMLAVHPSMPVKSVKEFLAFSRARPGQLNYGSGGNGSAAHLAVEYLKLAAKLDIVHIPYKGTAPMITDLIGGQLSLTITGVPPLLQHVRGGRLRALGVATTKRIALLPDLPTIAEAGVPGFEATQWYGVLAPAATPKDIVAKIHGEIVKFLKRPDTAEKMSGEGAEPVGSSPAEFGEHIRAEIQRWAKVIKASGARAE